MGSMKQIGDIWGREVLKFSLWTLIAALVCFLLYRILVNNTTQHLVPLSHVERDELMTVTLPASLADTLLRYEAFDVHFNPERGIANCAAYELTVGELLTSRAALCLPTMPVAGWSVATWCPLVTSSGARRPCISRF